MPIPYVRLFLFSGSLEVESFSQYVYAFSVKLPFKKTTSLHAINSVRE